ncbi:DsbA family protein [Halorubrum sp. BOL3-1]|uniref:DsbA family protein n=1 Tax=Halorubrum sp. BOL3-1 TaxID=2497325 RepID=UPI001004E8AA|nr:thioredoxin domain-containing protein [Halorubrum sp. BOL3-1]QAU12429.1 DsbA family protein [Halorubrum sp. BOL3-1]
MERTRRSLLAAGATVGAVGVVGCLGGGGTGLDLSGVELDTGEYDCDLEEPSDPDLDYRPTLGDTESDVVVQVFEDFTCGHCARYTANHFPTIREEYIGPGEIRYEHWDFPLPVNERWAVPVASAARGVGVRHGDEAFFEFASAAYESQGNYGGEAIAAAADTAGADPCAAMSDARFAAHGEASADDKSEGESMGVSGTPTIFVNGSPVEEGYAAESIAAAIDAEL